MTPPRVSDFIPSDHGISIHSPAKVNLSLRVIGKRDDRYHELDTVFQEIDWSDYMEFEESGSFSLEVVGADLPTDNRNLVARAASELSRVSGRPLRGRIRLLKSLPIQGGVGGGSSNAATTLIGLNHLWGLDWTLEKLIPIAASLGADCPFFLFGGLARGRSRGDLISPMPGSLRGTLLVLVPDFGVETASVFADFDLRLTEVEKNVIFKPLVWTEEGADYPQVFPRNDLENIVFQRFPVLREYRDLLLQTGAPVSLLSGSGSTLFGIYNSESEALDAARLLSQRMDFRVKVCRPVARDR